MQTVLTSGSPESNTTSDICAHNPEILLDFGKDYAPFQSVTASFARPGTRGAVSILRRATPANEKAAS
jgi:hypothetical protein